MNKESRRLKVLEGHLEIKDSRTNKEYKIEIHNNSIKASNL